MIVRYIIPIREVCSKETRSVRHPYRPYPLYESYKKIYNFNNLKDSLSLWRTFSEDENKCFEQALSILEVVLGEGTKSQVNVATDTVAQIAKDISNPTQVRGTVTLLKKSESDPVKKESYSIIESALNRNIEIQRVISNHEKISKRFNIDKTITEMAYNYAGEEEIVEQICSYIDTYKMGVDSKYKIAIEESLYLIYKNHLNISEASILQSVTDHFLYTELKESDIDGYLVNTMKNICESNNFLNDYSYVLELSNIVKPQSVQESILLSDYDKEIFNELTLDKVKTAIQKFKVMPQKTVDALKKTIKEIFVLNRDEDVIDSTQNSLSVIFYAFIVIGAFSIAVLPGIIALIVSLTINMTKERKYYNKVLKKWYAHRDATQKKIDACKDEEKKKKLEAYLKEVDKNIEKLEDHSDSLRGEDEEKADTALRPKNYSKKDDDFGDFDFDMKFESADQAFEVGKRIVTMASLTEPLKDKKQVIDAFLDDKSNIRLLDKDDLKYLVDTWKKYPCIASREALSEALLYHRSYIMESTTDISPDRYYLLSENSRMRESVDFDEEDLRDFEVEPDEIINELKEINEHMDHIVQCIHELSLGNNLQIAMDKVKGFASKLSDKEKSVSSTIDSTVQSIDRAIKKSLESENREAVIKGDILPSFSKLIKLVAAGVGIAYFIHPAVAAVAIIGRLAMSAKMQIKERKMIMDELDIDLRIIDKKIKDAEDEKDYTKEKKLRLLRNKMAHEHDRIQFTIKKYKGIEDSLVSKDTDSSKKKNDSGDDKKKDTDLHLG